MACTVLLRSLLFLLLSLLSIFPKSNSHPTYLHSFCSNTTTFTPNSKYHTNLNTLFLSLSSNATSSNFYNDPGTGDGNDNDTVYGLYMCRGDINATACQDCVSTATTTDLPKTYCPNGKSAVIWYDECMVRYSNESLFDTLDESPKFIISSSSSSSSQNDIIKGKDKNRFISLVEQTMRLLASRAATEYVSGSKFGTNETMFSSLVTLYVLAQCTSDLTDTECNKCLLAANGQLPVGEAGGRVLFPSCNVRYDTYPFYNGAVDLSLPLSPSNLSSSKSL